ncbi:MAG: hypothetical protein LBF55_07670 [Prevotellaceae bacterium]|jgi:hypothetical protein|nr:hypothetical protein [Prevotellaceae bacterium]
MNIKTLRFLPIWAMALAVGFAGCNNDDETPNVDEVIEDGFYLTGDATGYEKPDLNTKLIPATNEAAENAERAGLYDGYVYLEANKNFNVVEYVAGQTTSYGGTLSTVAGGANEEPAESYDSGTLTKDGSAYKVATNGLYHVIVDKQLAKTLVIPVPYWAVIGDLSGWGDVKLEQKSGASKSKVEFENTNVNFRAGGYKFRHTGGWKVTIADDGSVKANLNYGGNGSGSDSSLTPTLVTGGNNLNLTESNKGAYTVNLTWEPQKGYTATLTRTGDLIVSPAGQATFTLTVPSTTPADAHIGIVGSFTDNSWNIENPVTLTKGDDGKYTVTTEIPADFQYKYVISANGTSWSWDWAESGGNRGVPVDNITNVTDEVSAWTAIPPSQVSPAGQATFTLTVPSTTPADAHIGIVGSFADNSWNIENPVTLTKGDDGKYTVTTEIPEGFQYKYVISANGTNWSWDWAESGNNRGVPIDNITNVTDEVSAWTAIPSE